MRRSTLNKIVFRSLHWSFFQLNSWFNWHSTISLHVSIYACFWSLRFTKCWVGCPLDYHLLWGFPIFAPSLMSLPANATWLTAGNTQHVIVCMLYCYFSSPTKVGMFYCSAEFQDTWRFLDRCIKDALDFQKTVQEVLQYYPSIFPPIASSLFVALEVDHSIHVELVCFCRLHT